MRASPTRPSTREPPAGRADTPLAGVELAAAVEVEGNLAGGDARIPDPPFEPDAAGGQVEHLARGLGAQADGLDRARKPRADMNDVLARRQHEHRRGGALPPHRPHTARRGG